MPPQPGMRPPMGGESERVNGWMEWVGVHECLACWHVGMHVCERACERAVKCLFVWCGGQGCETSKHVLPGHCSGDLTSLLLLVCLFVLLRATGPPPMGMAPPMMPRPGMPPPPGVRHTAACPSPLLPQQHPEPATLCLCGVLHVVRTVYMGHYSHGTLHAAQPAVNNTHTYTCRAY